MKQKLWVSVTSLCLLTSCMEDDPSTVTYFCAPQDRQFTPHLANMLRADGFDTALGIASGGRDRMFVLEATRGSLRIWVQNQPADPPYSVADINNYSAPSVIPDRYVVSVQRRYPFYRAHVRETFERLRAVLLNKGYKEAANADCD